MEESLKYTKNQKAWTNHERNLEISLKLIENHGQQKKAEDNHEKTPQKQCQMIPNRRKSMRPENTRLEFMRALLTLRETVEQH